MVSSNLSSIVLILLTCVNSQINAFSIGQSTRSTSTSTTTQLGIFGDALKGAFANDERIPPAKNAGLTNVSSTK